MYLLRTIFLVLVPFRLWSAEIPPLKISHLTGDFYVYTTYKKLNGNPFPSNSMYLVTDSGVVMIDTPWDTTQFQPLLDSIKERHHKKVVLCIATHFHDDRTAGLEFLGKQGIKTYSSALTKELCIAHHEKQAAFTFSADTVFRVGNHTFQTYYPGEGHTKDNIVIWFPQEKILYGGCFIKSEESASLGNVADANTKEWKASVRRVKKRYKNAAYIIPGHFGWEKTGSLKHTLKLARKAG